MSKKKITFGVPTATYIEEIVDIDYGTRSDYLVKVAAPLDQEVDEYNPWVIVINKSFKPEIGRIGIFQRTRTMARTSDGVLEDFFVWKEVTEEVGDSSETNSDSNPDLSGQ